MDRGTFTVYVDADEVTEFLTIKENSDFLTMDDVNSILGDYCNSPMKRIMLETMCSFVETCYISRPDRTETYIKVQLPIYLMDVYFKILDNHEKLKTLF